MGHSDSEMLANYYHLHDDESERSMKALAEGSEFGLGNNSEKPTKTGTPALTSQAEKGSQRGTQGAKGKTPRTQTPVNTEDANGGSTQAERGRFELPIRHGRILVFETSAFNRSATSPKCSMSDLDKPSHGAGSEHG